MSWDADRITGELRGVNRQLGEANRQLQEMNLPPEERAALHAERVRVEKVGGTIVGSLMLYVVVWVLAHKLIGARVDGAFWWLVKNAVFLLFAAIPVIVIVVAVGSVGEYVWKFVRARRDR